MVAFTLDSSRVLSAARGSKPAGSKSARSGTYRPSRDPVVLLLAAIVVAAGVAMLAGVGISLQAGGPSEPLFPFPEGGTNESVSVSVNRTTVPPGGGVEVRITRVDATPVENASVFIAGDRYRTGPNGTVVVALPSTGTYEITARPPGTNDTSLTGRATVRVRRATVELEVVPNRSTIDVGESVAVTLQRSDNGTPVRGTIVAGNRTVRTGNDGRAVVTFDRGGRHRIVGRKNATDGTRFVEGTTTVRVRRDVVALEIDLSDNAVTYGSGTTVTVTRADSGEPVRATVEAGDRTVRTGPDGTATLSSVPPGSHSVTATAEPTPKTRFEPATTSLRVHRRTVRLELSAEPARLPVGNRTTLTVRRADTGERVAATIEVADRVLRTGPDGRAAVALDRPGRFGAVATRENTSTETFEAAGTSVVWTGPDVRLAAVNVPPIATVDGPVLVVVTLENRGNAAGCRTVTVSLAGDPRVSRTVRVPPGDRHTIELSVSAPSSSGYYLLVVSAGDAWRPIVVLVRPENVSTGRTPR